MIEGGAWVRGWVVNVVGKKSVGDVCSLQGW